MANKITTVAESPTCSKQRFASAGWRLGESGHKLDLGAGYNNFSHYFAHYTPHWPRDYLQSEVVACSRAGMIEAAQAHNFVMLSATNTTVAKRSSK